LIFTIKQIDKNPNNKHNDTAIKENSILQENIKIKIDWYNIYRNLIIGETKIGTIVNVWWYKLNIHKGSKVWDTFTIKWKWHKWQNWWTDWDLIFEIKEISKWESTSKQEIINERQDKEINRKIFGMILLLMIMAFIILVSIFN
jgi:hypothetical protein